MATLAIDIGGGSIKALAIGDDGTAPAPPRGEQTPSPATPDAVMEVVVGLAEQVEAYRRVSVGFPGIVKGGVTINAPNLGNDLWDQVPIAARIEESLGVPTRAVNDADLQGLGVVQGHGVELVLTLGTGLGAGLFTRGILVPNLELGHHPFRDGHTYEDLVRDTELKRIGAEAWSQRVLDAIEQIEKLFSCDQLHLGGGNVQNLRGDVPGNVRFFTLEEALLGSVRLWDDP
ncbi:MAG: ROK family protein [Myxococcota bacterium]